MIDDARAALGACQEELRQLDQHLAETDGEADPLAVATALVDLTKVKAGVMKLAAALTLPAQDNDDGPGGPDV